MALSLSRSDTNTTPHYWLSLPISECYYWVDLISKVHKEQEAKEAKEKKKTRKK